MSGLSFALIYLLLTVNFFLNLKFIEPEKERKRGRKKGKERERMEEGERSES